ncbi:MAG: peptidylprolyl isomerase [Longimicrobiales bacterium]
MGPGPIGPRGVVRAFGGRVVAIVLALSLSGCGEPPVLEVGPVGYGAEEISGLSASQRTLLTHLTAFGLAVADGRVEELLAPRIQGDLQSIVLQQVAMEVAVTDAGTDEGELRAAYARDPQQELKVRHLVVMSERWRPEEHRDSARARAAEALERARAGEAFEAVVAEYSDEPRAAERGGLLESGREGSWVPEFWEAASSLDEGEISDVVETEFGFHVIRLEERRPVPFEEARPDVLERFVDLPQALGRASEWVAAIQARMRVDTAALTDWQAGDAVERPFVRWPDSLAVPDYGAAELEEYVRTFRSESLHEVRQMTAEELAEFVTGTTRTHILLARADREGVEVSESQRAAVTERWHERVARWAAALGFREGMSRKAVKAGALEALGAPAQSAAQARAELPRLSDRLEELYPIRYQGDPGA